MNTNKPGNFLTAEDVGKRDSFHAACVATYSSGLLQPGDSIILSNGWGGPSKCDRDKRNAIVDPFLIHSVPAGTPFWAFVLPEKVKQLTHHFEVEGVTLGDVADAQSTLKDYSTCASWGCSVG